MSRIAKTALRVAIFALTMAVLCAFIVQAVTRPIAGESHPYSAIFTDANGLKTGDDVRMFGVAVGKVRSIELRGDRAVVGFSALADRHLYDNTTVAVRYQNLTGQRYLDIQQPEHPGLALPSGTTISTEHTIPSFDITTLFNGMEPVLAELSPSALNQFSESMLALIQGNGTGVGPALDAIAKLSDYVSSRQVVISALITNLKQISDAIGGRSPELITLITQVKDIFTTLQEKFDGVVDFALTAPSVLAPLDSLMNTLGLTQKQNPDFDSLIRAQFPDPQLAVDTLGRLPSLLQALRSVIPSTGAGVELACSKGSASAPPPIRLLIAGQRISICNG